MFQYTNKTYFSYSNTMILFFSKYRDYKKYLEIQKYNYFCLIAQFFYNDALILMYTCKFFRYSNIKFQHADRFTIFFLQKNYKYFLNQNMKKTLKYIIGNT
ncbi:hypothetical protein EDEG_01171 [Edhazardia aedis USNM 41457]|uniref:Uncharacterized protein n=1 Tax=Edhazardia aedis (strain USNM 41457) TaxID=1003232 RepID=J9DAV6_EDHAE|nr:hypothetical protein EDEG_01171 [Edhazardia aedis USNM 41457]|eukprot:EJW04619.1 hypothetical protein EDEG_01171 [Edhazardia aedis USNM 41457]